MEDRLEPEYKDVFTAWKSAPSPETSGNVLRAVQPVIDSAVKSYATAAPGPLLQSRARRLVLDALPSYDPARAGLKTHLTSRLQGLRRIHADQSHVLAIPEMLKIDAGRVQQARSILADELGREPTQLEVADRSGFSLKRLKRISQVDFGVPEGMLGRDTETGEAAAPGVVSTNDDWRDFVYHSLPPQDQLVMEYTYGLHGRRPLSGKELAIKLGVTPAAISQRKARIQKYIDDRASFGVL